MGYTGTYITGTAENYLRKELTSEHYKPIANKGAQYWVCEYFATGERFAIVANATNRKGYLTYKLIGDTEGPGDYNFPLNLLNMLTPTANEWSNEWRKKVQAYHADKKALPKLTPGCRVRFSKPLSFTDGFSYDELIYDGGFRFYAVRTYGRENYRLSKNWRRVYQWTIVGGE